MMKLLLVQTGFLGDVILSTAVIDNLAQFYPQATLSILTTPQAASLVRNHPAVSQVITFDKRATQSGFKGLLQMAQRLKDEQFDIVFSLHKSWRTAVLLYLSKIPLRFGFKEAKGGFLYTKTVKRNDLTHDSLRNLAILRAIGLNPADLQSDLSLYFGEEEERESERLLEPLRDRNIIGIAPGSVWATKRWRAEGFSEVARHFANEGWGVVLLGGPSDIEIARRIEAEVGGQILNLVGHANLAVSAAIVKRMSLLVSNDSAPLHLASATKTPVVAIFCATVPEFGYGPWKTEAITIGVDNLFCRPCRRHGGNYCPNGSYACQTQISAQQVIAAGETLLRKTHAIPELTQHFLH